MSEKEASYISYTCIAGDTFDRIAFQFYREERMAHYILQANPLLMNTLIFEGGESIRVPRLNNVNLPETLPPWRR